MAQFDVDFTGSMRQLGEFNLRLTNMGNQLDHMEKAFGKTGSVSKEVFEKMRTSVKTLTEQVTAAGGSTEQLGKKLADAEGHVASLFQKMAAENAKATLVAQAYTGEMSALNRMLADTSSKNTFITYQQKIQQITEKLVNENRFLRASIKAADSELGKSNAKLKVNLAHKQSLATAEQRLRNSGDKLVMTYAGLSSEQGRSNVMTQQYIATKKSQITEEFRLDAQLKTLERTLASLNGGQQEQIAKTQQLIAVRKAEITETMREDAELKKLERTLRSLNGGQQEAIVVARAAIAARKKIIVEALSERKAVDEVAAAIRREENQLIRLQVQSRMMSSSHGQKMTQLRQNIKEQENLNRVLSMSTMQLLGFTGAQNRANLAMAAGSQSAAMLRAGLQGMNASIGMYTSGTIIMATATFAVAAAMRNAVTTGMEFTATMSRANAIMSTSTASWMTDSGKSFKAMEAQVRALGQSTIFTASQVAEGLNELGMAGLSAGDAIVALRPALSLANIANVSMARSADISTNTMMIFGMEASELGDIVDVMATAVNNSNTDIEQLANALTYAGPAAQTAGISFKDTTAAIEALANSGIKGSRAGSALRRMFVSILNPTKKGSAVISKYGLDVKDAEGNTRSLIDIVGQMSTAFKDLPGGERLGAIQNLVGVYATSPIAALVDQIDNLERFRRQLDETANAAEKMEKKIADNLKFDWKAVISSFEEVQLQAFDSVEGRLREASMSMSKYLIELTHPIPQAGETYEQTLIRQKEATNALTKAQEALNNAKKNGASEGVVAALTGDVSAAQNNVSLSSITELDQMLQKAQTAAEAIGKMVLGILAFKLATGNVLGAFSADLKKTSIHTAELSARSNATTASMRALAPSVNYASTALQVQSRAAIAASGAWGAFTGSLSGATAAMARWAAVAAGAMRFLGWVGLIAGIGYALHSLWDSDTNQDILDNKNSVDATRNSYEELKKSVQGYAIAKERAALGMQVEADTENKAKVEDRIKTRQEGIAVYEQAGLPTQALKDDLKGLILLNEDYARKIKAAQAELDKIGTTMLDVSEATDKQDAANRKAIEATNKLAEAQKNMLDKSRSGMNDLKGQSLVAKLTKEMQEAEAAAKGAEKYVMAVKVRLIDLASVEVGEDQRRLEEGRTQMYEAQLSAAGKLYEAEKNLGVARADMAAFVEKTRVANDAYTTAVKAGDVAAQNAAAKLRPGVDTYNRLTKALDGASEAFYKLQAAATFRLDLSNAKEALEDYYRTDEQKLAKAKQDLASLEAAAEPGPFASDALRDEAEAKRLGLKLTLLQKIDGMEKKGAKGEAAGDRAADAAKRAIDSAQSAYDSLAKKIDPVTAAQRQLKKSTTDMTLLRANNKITVEQQILATGQLNLAYYEAVQALDKNKVALDAVKESYGTSPFLDTASDLAVMNQALDAGTLSLTEYIRLTDRLEEKRKESATSGLPTANLSVGDSSSSPFTDWVSTEVERAQGLSDFNKRHTDIGKGKEDELAKLNDQFAARMDALNAQKLIEQGAEAEHNQKMIQLQEEFQRKRTSIIETAGKAQEEVTTKQTQYAEQMSTMALAAAMGTVSNVLATFASASADATTAQKIAFVAQKAIAVAQILMYTHLAAAQAMTIPGDEAKVMGIGLSAFILGTGYANAGLVAGLAIGELASGGKSSSGGGGGTQMYDTGGFIPYNRTGIAGEYGPELVSGPAHITGRGNSAAKLASNAKGGDGGGMQLIISPQINIEAGAAQSPDDAKRIGESVSAICVTEISKQIRPNGILDTWYRNKQQRG